MPWANLIKDSSLFKKNLETKKKNTFRNLKKNNLRNKNKSNDNRLREEIFV